MVGESSFLSSAQRRGGACRAASSSWRPATITVKASLLRYVRRGVCHEIVDILRALRVEVAHNPIDVRAYRKGLTHLDNARMPLDTTGLSDSGDARDVEVDSNDGVGWS